VSSSLRAIEEIPSDLLVSHNNYQRRGPGREVRHGSIAAALVIAGVAVWQGVRFWRGEDCGC
jgi:hypothetical protein